MHTIAVILEPIVRERRRAAAAGEEDVRVDMLRWLLEAEPGASAMHVVGSMLFMSVATIHTSSFTLTHAPYDQCAMPTTQAELQQEALATYSRSSRLDWTLDSLRRLRRMDAFPKESHRVNSPSVLNYKHLLRKDLVLADGTVLPAGAMLCVAGAARSKGLEIQGDPQAFRPLRFYVGETADKEAEARNLFTGTLMKG